MFKFALPIISLIVGGLIGSILTVNASLGIAKYLSIAILAAFDAVLGGARGLLEDTFDSLIMLSGFFINALLAMALAFLGDQIGVDMFMAATVCFALRIFSNLAFIRRDIITRYRERSSQKIQIRRIKITSNKGIFNKDIFNKDISADASDEPNLENTISGLLLDRIPQDTAAKYPAAYDPDDEELDLTPLKVRAMVSPDKADKAKTAEVPSAEETKTTDIH